MQLEKVYEPQQFEPRWAEWWIERGFYAAPSTPLKSGEEMFSLVIPPPNVTGMLHIGHMLEHTEIDVTVRWHRMRGDRTLWVPGTDHAGIATQMVVERSLREQGLSRHDLGREDFVKRVWAWKEEYGGTILRQMRRTGTSVDWTRNRFTMDPGLSRAVRETFVRLWEKGLLYRGEYMVNWCPQCQTALSDLEVVHEESAGHLWHIRYPVNGLPGRFVTVATTRPETMLGDTAVAINVKDERYKDLHGRTVTLPLMGREIPVILDELANPEFGTGVVKVTPAHDPNDFEAGKRHNLPLIRVINENAVMTQDAGPYAGLDRYEARRRVLAHLEDQGLLEKTADYTLSVGRCQRCKTVVEPLISMQWFCKMKPLAEPAIAAVEDGRIRIVPENWVKTYNEWMYNIRDWCVSRQLWWGHRIPAWYCKDCGQVIVSREDPTQCPKCGSNCLEQDSDVLDTWFSSGLWPFSTLGWPDQTQDLKTYYPTTLLITGFDILFFWVARMIMLGMECMGEVPFRTVYIHGLVRDAQKQKMSKTRGNVIDPLAVTEKYGTDAVRFSLLRGAAPGTDIVLSEERMVSSRAFANKIWNAARFIFLQMEKSGVRQLDLAAIDDQLSPADDTGALEDAWIFHRLNLAAQEIDAAQRTYRFHEVAEVLYGFLWDEFCDWYLELKKLTPESLRNLLRVFEYTLRLLHPVMPFLTEEIWQRLVMRTPAIPESISIAPYPQPNPALANPEAARQFTIFQDMVTATRALRADQKLDPNLEVDGVLLASGEPAAVAARMQPALETLTNVRFTLGGDRPAGASRATPDFEVVLKLAGAQAEAMKKRLEKEIEQLVKVIDSNKRQLGSESFVAKAPAHVVDGMRLKLGEYESQLAKSRATLVELK